MSDELYRPSGREVSRSMAVLPEDELMRVVCAAASELGWRGHVHPAAWLDALKTSMARCDPHVLFAVIADHAGDVERPEPLPHTDEEHEAFVAFHRQFVEVLRGMGYDVDGLGDITQTQEEDEDDEEES